MPDSTRDPIKQALLRNKAETRLREGTAPHTKGWTLNSDALALLYKLASDPGQSDAALKLLHELQTYQVELDLQHEQLESNEHDLVHALNYYNALFDYAPVGYLIVNRDDLIVEGNLVGAKLLGVTQDELVNTPVSSFLTPASHATINALLKKVRDDRTSTSCAVQPTIRGKDPRLLRITADISPDGETVLMVFSV